MNQGLFEVFITLSIYMWRPIIKLVEFINRICWVGVVDPILRLVLAAVVQIIFGKYLNRWKILISFVIVQILVRWNEILMPISQTMFSFQWGEIIVQEGTDKCKFTLSEPSSLTEMKLLLPWNVAVEFVYVGDKACPASTNANTWQSWFRQSVIMSVLQCANVSCIFSIVGEYLINSVLLLSWTSNVFFNMMRFLRTRHSNQSSNCGLAFAKLVYIMVWRSEMDESEMESCSWNWRGGWGGVRGGEGRNTLLSS